MERSRWGQAGLTSWDIHTPYGGSLPSPATPVVLRVAEPAAV